MKIQQKLLVIILFLFTTVLAGCNVIPETNEIEEIPAGARKVASMDLTARSGTYTFGDIDVWGNGYIIFEVEMGSGTMSSLGVKDIVKDEVVFEIRRPKTALYDSESYEYKVGSEYELSLVNAKNITGSVNVYFVSE